MFPIHLVQLRQLREQIPDAVAISSLYEDAPLFIKKAYAARTQWLDENQELAGAFCASVLKASRELPEDFDLFVSAVNQFVGEPPNEEVLREIFDIISTYNFWPKNGELDPESILFMAELGQLGGLLKKKPNPEEVVDRRPLKRALELLGGRVE
jgi:NitT/TauT family transport system substrate-binding protein